MDSRRPDYLPLSSAIADPEAPGSGARDTVWFRFGDGYLGLRCDDEDYRARFLDLYSECRVDGPASTIAIHCSIASTDETVRVVFDDPGPLDQIPFALSALAEFDYIEAPSPAPGWRVLRSARHAGALRFDRLGFDADKESPWPTIAGALSIHRVLRLQPHALFFHAAAVAIDGRGLLLMGPKESGKTTLSLALAERGHQFFSDEMSALRRDSLEILPLRRRLSIRPGPSAETVRQALDRGTFPVVELSDGTIRTRAQPAQVGAAVPLASVAARAICFLGAKGDRPRAGRFTATAGDLRLLAPYESATWGQPPAQLALGMLRLLARVRCYHLDLGPIDETVRLLEALMMEE